MPAEVEAVINALRFDAQFATEPFDILPALNLVLKVVSVGYLLWLAFKIATAAPVEERDADSSPMTFLQAATFQWV